MKRRIKPHKFVHSPLVTDLFLLMMGINNTLNERYVDRQRTFFTKPYCEVLWSYLGSSQSKGRLVDSSLHSKKSLRVAHESDFRVSWVVFAWSTLWSLPNPIWTEHYDFNRDVSFLYTFELSYLYTVYSYNNRTIQVKVHRRGVILDEVKIDMEYNRTNIESLVTDCIKCRIIIWFYLLYCPWSWYSHICTWPK